MPLPDYIVCKCHVRTCTHKSTPILSSKDHHFDSFTAAHCICMLLTYPPITLYKPNPTPPTHTHTLHADSSDGSTNLDSVTLSKLASKSSPLSDDVAVSRNSSITNNIDHPLQRSLEVGTEVIADEGAPSRDTHPLLNSGD